MSIYPLHDKQSGEKLDDLSTSHIHCEMVTKTWLSRRPKAQESTVQCNTYISFTVVRIWK